MASQDYIHDACVGPTNKIGTNTECFQCLQVSGSVMSVYSGDFGNLEVKGNIQFAVDYVDSLKELHVFVAQCKDLAAADVKKQRSDPLSITWNHCFLLIIRNLVGIGKVIEGRICV